MCLKYKYLLSVLFLTAGTFAQIGIGTTTPAGALDVTSTTNGMLVPRVTLTSRLLSAPVVNPQGGGPIAGTLVWNNMPNGVPPNNVVPGFYYWNGLMWVALGGSGGNDWSITGNSGMNGGTTVTAGTNFIGTTDSQNFDIRTNNAYVARFSRLGEFFIGTLNTVIAGDLMNAVATAAFPWSVNGYTAFNGGAVYGSITSGTSGFGAVQGEYWGTGGGGNGVRGLNASIVSGTGVYGAYQGLSTGTGVMGQYAGTLANGVRVGVRGASSSGFGNQQIGVQGDYNAAAWGIGLMGIGFGGGIPGGNIDYAIVGWSGNNFNYSGYFNGNHVIANGTKSASVGTSKGNQLLYVTESPEVWFEDIGRSKLINGYVEVKLDPLFLETIFIDNEHPMSVFLQEEGDSNGLYVIPGIDGFIVKEKNNGTSNISFSYRIMAKRRHFQDHRFGNDPVWGEGDTRKFSEYAVPPKIDYLENERLRDNQRKNYKEPLYPPGFVPYKDLPKVEPISRMENPNKK